MVSYFDADYWKTKLTWERIFWKHICMKGKEDSMSYCSQAYFTSNIKILEKIFCIFKAKNVITNELMTLFCFEAGSKGQPQITMESN